MTHLHADPRRASPAPAASPAAVPLRVSGATRSFGATRALDGVSFDLRAGELLALLGPNGAGKTTLIRSIAGRVRLDAGTVELLGRPPGPGARGALSAEARAALGVVPQEIALYPLLTARENLEAFGELHGVARAELKSRVEWALEWTTLADRAKHLVRSFSGGMKRRLNIACGVLHRPRVVLLDEPTVGVDPQSRERIYDMLAALRREGAALLLTTHQLEEAEARCDRVVIMDRGRAIAEGTVAGLVDRTLGRRRAAVLSLASPPAALPPGTAATGDPLRVRAELADVGADLERILGELQRSGARVEDVHLENRGLHEVFLQLTGKDLRE